MASASLDDIVAAAGSASLDDISPPDPVEAKPKGIADLPSQQQFDQSHQGAKLEMEAAPPETFFQRLKQFFVGNPHAPAGQTDTALGRSLGISYEAPSETKNAEGTPKADLPLVRFTPFAPQNPTTIPGGIAQGAAQFAEGMTTGKNLSLMAASGGLGQVASKVGQYLPRAVSAVFSADMLKSAYDQYPGIKAKVDAGDWPGAAAAITRAGLTAGMGVAAGAHALRGEATPIEERQTPTESARAGVAALSDIHEPEARTASLDDVVQPEPRTAKLSEVEPAELENPNRRVTGSSNPPLNATGRGQAQELAQNTAGQFTQINTTPMARGAESAQIVASRNPGAQVTASEGLGPLKLGEHEGQPVETEQQTINDRIKNRPDEPAPGVSPTSGQPGESFNDAKDRFIGTVQKQAETMQPGDRVLNFTHGRQLRMLDAWADAGFPEDRSIDAATMTREGDWAKPGQLMQLTPDGLKPVTSAEQPGIYFARHGETDYSADKPASGNSTSNEGAKPEATPLWEMAPDQLSAAETEAKGREQQDIENLFGADGAQRYRRLERVANSTTRSHQETDAAQAEIDKMEAGLSEQQRNQLYGIADDRPQLDEIRDYRQALGRLDWSSPEALGDSLKWAVTGIGDKSDPAEMTPQGRVRYAQLRYAMNEAQARGWDTAAISQAALRGAAARFGNPSDAAFMLRRYAAGGEPRAADAQQHAIETRAPGTPAAYGREVTISVPGETTKYPARYAVRELSDIQASHNPFSFEGNPKYEYTNDRDYSQTGNAARVVKQSGPETFDPQFLTTESPTAEQGTPIIDANGNVLGGNSRTMTIARVYQRGGADEYMRQVDAKAQQLGINPEDFARFKRPVLVREIPGGVDAQRAITDFNKTAAAELSPEERAVSDGRRLSPQTISEISGRLDDLGEEGTLAGALRGEDGAGIVNNLVRDGVITEQEKNGFVDDRGHLTPEAKARIGKALVGRLFDTPAEFRETTPEMRNKLERIAPQVLRVEGREGWGLTDQLRGAVALVDDARAHKIPVEDAARQTAIGGREYSPEEVQLAKALEGAPTKAAGAFRRYANDEALSREGAQGAFFQPPTREEAFLDAFAPKAREATPVYMGSGLGALQPIWDKFEEEDLRPALTKLAGDFAEAKDDIQKVVAPTVRSESAATTGLVLRQRMAQFARRYDQGTMRLREARDFFGKRAPEDNYQFIDNIERGRDQGDDNLNAIAKAFRGMMDQRRREVQGLGEGALKNFYLNYFPHVFEKPEAATKLFDAFFKNRSFEGPKSFLKHREFPTFKDALEAGAKPISDNPVDLIMLKAREMDRYLLAHHALRDMADGGIAKRLARTEEERGQLPLEAQPEGPFKQAWIAPTKADLPANFVRIVDPVGGGKWYAEEGAAQVINNYLSPGLRARSGAARLLLGLNNVMNQANLGLSAFHLKAESISSMANRASNGFVAALRGDPAAGAFKILTSPAAPFVDYMKGSQMLRDWYKPGSEGAPIAAMTDALIKGGGRSGQPADYANRAIDSMVKQFQRGNYIGALGRSPFAAIETLAKPIMENIVPRMKLGAFAELAQAEMDKLGASPRVEDVQAAMAGAWDHVENRLGEMTYDNLFWNRSFKDIMHLMVRSVGWNLGDLREYNSAGGALKQLARGQRPADPHGLAFVLGYAFTAAWMGAIYGYLKTGKGPQALSDYMFPMGDDGKRHVIAPYVKDSYQFARDLPGTLIHKTGPLVNTLAEMVTNKDYYDRPIRNLDDPLIKQLQQEAEFIGRQFLPFTVQERFGQTKAQKKQAADERANPEHAVEHFLGVQPAPAQLQPGYKPAKDRQLSK